MPDAPFDPQEHDFTEIFRRELEAIRLDVHRAAELIPQRIADISDRMGKMLLENNRYNTGPSVPPSAGNVPLGTSLSDWGSAGGSGGLGGSEALLRQQLLELQKINNNLTTSPPADVNTSGRTTAPRRIRDVSSEPDIEGTQTGTPRGKTWRERTVPGGLGGVLPFPRYPGAQPTTADFLNYLSSATANVAQRRQTVLDRRMAGNQGAQDWLEQHADEDWVSTNQDGSYALSGQVPANLRSEWAQYSPDTRLGHLSDIFANAENAYAQSRYIKGILSKIAAPITGAQNYAYQTGYTGGTPLFLGIRNPFDAAAAGWGQKLSQIGFAFGHNVSPGQAAAIYNNLFSQGWYGGDATNNMRTAAANMMQQNPYIASMPQYYEMMDRSTRFGAAALSTFNEAMYQVPQAAKTAKVSITDMMSQMDQLGQYNTQIGGPYQAGLLNALDWAQTTGMPPAVMGQLMQNPLVIGQTFAATGLMPQMQGLASPFQHMEGIMGTLNMLNRAIITPGTRTYRDPITGLTSTVSGEKQKAALISSQLGIPIDQVQALLKNQTGIMHGMEVQNSSEMWRNAIIGAGQHGRLGQAQNELLGAPWARLLEAAKTATGSRGEKIFEDWDYYRQLRNEGKSKTEAHRLAQAEAISNVRNAGTHDVLSQALDNLQPQYDGTGRYRHRVTTDTERRINAALQGSSAQQNALAREIMEGKVKGVQPTAKMMAAVAQDRFNQIRKYERGDTKRFGPSTPGNSGPALTIELGPAAKKMFHLADPNGQQKAQVNAGGATVNLNSYVNGYTAAPYPNLNTAGGTSTWGDQNSFNNYVGNP